MGINIITNNTSRATYLTDNNLVIIKSNGTNKAYLVTPGVLRVVSESLDRAINMNSNNYKYLYNLETGNYYSLVPFDSTKSVELLQQEGYFPKNSDIEVYTDDDYDLNIVIK